MTPEKNDLFFSIDCFASFTLDCRTSSGSDILGSSCFVRLNWSSFDRLRVKGGDNGFDSVSRVGAVVIIAGAGEMKKLALLNRKPRQHNNDGKYTYSEEQLELAAQSHGDF
jgi:hypothetical protein